MSARTFPRLSITEGVVAESWEPQDWPPVWADRWGEDTDGKRNWRYADICLDKLSMRFRWIPPGAFPMGSPENETGRMENEGPRHTVKISCGFWMSHTVVTEAIWRAVQGAEPDPETANLPQGNVNWHEAMEFAARLQDRLTREKPFREVFRLPTEAEWEYACRAGTKSAFNNWTECTEPFGRDPGLDSVGWFDHNSDQTIHEVAKKPANDWGLHDMHGNVWEWCLDGPRKYKEAELTDPLGPIGADAFCVARGGAWYDLAQNCRSACRDAFGLGDRWPDRGLRLAAGQPLQTRSEGRAEGEFNYE